MRWLLGLCLVLAGCSSCRTKETATKDRVEPVADAASPAPPPPPAPAPVVIFEDAGDGGTIDLGHGITFEIHPAGPSLILLELHEPKTPKPKWRKIFLERRLVGGDGGDGGDAPQTDQFDNWSWGHRSQAMHSARAGETWEYRAKLDEGGAWTKDLKVRTADPKTPPPPPTNVTATAESPWAIDLTWQTDVRAVAGIEVDIETIDPSGTKDWMLLAVVNPHETKFSHGYRLGKQTARYRVATFNRSGKSAFVETPSVTTPEKDTRPASSKPKPLPPCTKLPPPADPMKGFVEEKIQSDPELWSFPGGEGGIAPRRLFGYYRGCMRELGAFTLQGDPLTHQREGAPSTEGFPVLVGIMGAGQYVGVQLGTFAFANGHYEAVDAAQFCGAVSTSSDFDKTRPYAPNEAGEITDRRGPFDDCIHESPLH